MNSTSSFRDFAKKRLNRIFTTKKQKHKRIHRQTYSRIFLLHRKSVCIVVGLLRVDGTLDTRLAAIRIRDWEGNRNSSNNAVDQRLTLLTLHSYVKRGLQAFPLKIARVMLLERRISRADQLLTADECHIDTVGFSSFQLTWLLSAGCDDSWYHFTRRRAWRGRK